MRRIFARSLVALASVVTLTATTTPAHAANAGGIAEAALGLKTTGSFGGASFTVVAEGSFYGGLVANSAVALQAAGIEQWVDARGIARAMPVACHGEAVRFTSTNTVSCTISLNSADSIVHIDWTAEAFGAAPTPFLGTCTGTATRSGGTELVVPVC